MKKKYLYPIIVIFLATASASAYLYFNLNSIIERTAERAWKNALGVNVDIIDLDISLLEKRVTVGKITIDNPEGYIDRYIMEINHIDIVLNKANRQLIDLNSVEIGESIVNIEINKSGMNVLKFEDNLHSSGGSSSYSPSAEDATNVIIQKAIIPKSFINLHVYSIDHKIPSITIPSISLNNLGKDGNEYIVKNAIVQILSEYIRHIKHNIFRHPAIKGIDASNMGDIKYITDKTAEDIQHKVKSSIDDKIEGFKKDIEGSVKDFLNK